MPRAVADSGRVEIRIDPESKATTQSVYNGALALGIANQLTNILRDVGEE